MCSCHWKKRPNKTHLSASFSVYEVLYVETQFVWPWFLFLWQNHSWLMTSETACRVLSSEDITLNMVFYLKDWELLNTVDGLLLTEYPPTPSLDKSGTYHGKNIALTKVLKLFFDWFLILTLQHLETKILSRHFKHPLLLEYIWIWLILNLNSFRLLNIMQPNCKHDYIVVGRVIAV